MVNFDEEEHFKTLFEYAPISLWEQDFSGIKRLFDGLRSRGVRSLESHLDEHPEFVDECMGQILTLNVNEMTLTLLQAKSQDELIANLDRVFRGDMRRHFRDELLSLWAGQLTWSGEGINYTLTGDPVDIRLHWRILPGSEESWKQVLVTLEDITARKEAERRFENLFEAAPISLWEEDFSALKTYFDALRAQGVVDLEEYLVSHPEAVTHCMNLLKVLDVNQKTLELFGAETKEQLIASLDRIFRDEMGVHFTRELIDLWNGKLSYEREGVNYSLNGEAVNILLDLRVMPGHEQDFGWVQVAIQDITVRKKAEDYLRYLGTHDVMTGLFNRAYFQETIAQMEKSRRDPLSVIIADLNGLKRVNDTLGHQAGDNIIRRAAEVVKASLDETCIAARIGGDEFVILRPQADEQAAAEAIERLRELVTLNNKYYREPELSLAIGAATSSPGLPLEKVISLADDAMYLNKGQYYRRRATDQ